MAIVPTTIVDSSQDPDTFSNLPPTVNAFKVVSTGRVFIRVRDLSGTPQNQGFDPDTAQVVAVQITELVLPFQIDSTSGVDFSGPIAI